MRRRHVFVDDATRREVITDRWSPMQHVIAVVPRPALSGAYGYKKCRGKNNENNKNIAAIDSKADELYFVGYGHYPIQVSHMR